MYHYETLAKDKVVCSNNRLTKLCDKANLQGNMIKILSVSAFCNSEMVIVFLYL
jgi:hypothetical protein